MKLLLTYDISNTKSRTKVATLLEGYGYRVNFSVFDREIISILNRGTKITSNKGRLTKKSAKMPKVRKLPNGTATQKSLRTFFDS